MKNEVSNSLTIEQQSIRILEIFEAIGRAADRLDRWNRNVRKIRSREKYPPGYEDYYHSDLKTAEQFQRREESEIRYQLDQCKHIAEVVRRKDRQVTFADPDE